jgi:hypothetical protein
MATALLHAIDRDWDRGVIYSMRVTPERLSVFDENGEAMWQAHEVDITPDGIFLSNNAGGSPGNGPRHLFERAPADVMQ